ncbi:choice-of-anchor D domain-containing protein [bacterium]|nr:choice-of-anchor D domain-containing protein [bacterium]
MKKWRAISVCFTVLVLSGWAYSGSFFTPVAPSGLPYHIIVGSITIDARPVPDGAEIGVFDDTLCVGYFSVTSQGQTNLDIVTWQGNPSFGLAGFVVGHVITFKIWAELYGEWQELGANPSFSVGDGTFGYGSYTSAGLTANSIVNPQITVQPAALDFGTVTIGQSISQVLTITNSGTAQLAISSITTDNSCFTVGSYSSTLNPDQSINVNVTFTPDAALAMQANLTIVSDDPVNSNLQVSLSGQGILASQATILVVSNSLDFGSVEIGVTATQTLQIQNIGNQTLTVTSVSSSNSRFVPRVASFTIAAGEAYTLALDFTPTSEGTFSGYLRIQSNAANNTNYQVSLTGYGYASYFTPVTPTGLPYIIVIDSATVDNRGFQTGDQIAVFDGELCVGLTIFLEYPIQVTAWQSNSDNGLAGFTPGDPITFKVLVDAYEQWVELIPQITWGQGNGTFGDGEFAVARLKAYSGLEPIIEVNVTALQFSSVQVGGQTTLTFTVTNEGKSDLTVNNIASTSSAFWASPTNFTLVPSSMRRVTVTFQPSEAMPYSANLMIYSNANTSAVNIALTGQGLPAMARSIQVSTTPIIFTVTKIGATANSSVTIINTGSAPVTITGVQFSSPRFSTTVNNIEIAAGASYNLPIKFTPNVVGLISGSLTINNNSQNNPTPTINLSGAGYEGYFQPVEPTGIPYTIIVDTMQSFSGLTPSVGDEIGIFDGRLCVGSIVIDPGVNTLSGIAWQENPSANLPGFKLGNPISFRYYARGESISNIYVVQYESVEGNGRFGTPPYTSVKLNISDILVYLNPPQNVVAIDSLQAITLKWNANTEDDLVYYNVYRSEFPDLAPDSTFFRGKIFAPDTTFIDSLIQNNTTYYYTVTAVDTAENESQPSLLTSVIAIVIKVWDVSFNQIRDGNAIVDIFYSFSGHDTTHYYITPYISFDEGKAWSIIETNIPTTLPGINITTNFNLMSTYPDIYLKDAKIKIDVSTFRKNQP